MNNDKKKQKIAKAMDVKGPKKHGEFGKSLADLKRHAGMFSPDKHVAITHQGKHHLAF